MWLWPHTITLAVTLRQKYDSYLELSEVPSETIWDFPVLIRQHVEKLYPHKDTAKTEIAASDVEE